MARWPRARPSPSKAIRVSMAAELRAERVVVDGKTIELR
jgi:hypothetical protein